MVVVAGAGPAGATAARALALAGVPVRLIDRSAFPRSKPCGGAISMRVLARFPYLEHALGRITTHRISRLHLEAPDGRSTLVTSNDPRVPALTRAFLDYAQGRAAYRALRRRLLMTSPLLAVRIGTRRLMSWT